jgi:hypothetical protein
LSITKAQTGWEVQAAKAEPSANPPTRPAKWAETPEEILATEQWNPKHQNAQPIFLSSYTNVIQLRIRKLNMAKTMPNFVDCEYKESCILYKSDQ